MLREEGGLMLMKVGFCEVWGRAWETEVADGEAGMRGDDWLQEREVGQKGNGLELERIGIGWDISGLILRA